ncbi:hypothetical protein MTYP_03173 [Methylophilaceae bacterium]|nr:hypothetical protein MTYP_03173 [Methylophilaceae bacterium]
MFHAGDIIAYLDMCKFEGVSLQRGMNFHLHNGLSVVLMSLRKGAPYEDRVEDNWQTLIYEGHDIPKDKSGLNPKQTDQPLTTGNGKPTQNGLFYNAAIKYKAGAPAEKVRVYEKIKNGIWAYTGLFNLVDAWIEQNTRKVIKFKLKLIEEESTLISSKANSNIEHTRVIPTSIKLDVWKRDKGMCTLCGSKDNLHFDHIIPFSKGGSSITLNNIQLLCARHNIAKKDRIE